MLLGDDKPNEHVHMQTQISKYEHAKVCSRFKCFQVSADSFDVETLIMKPTVLITAREFMSAPQIA